MTDPYPTRERPSWRARLFAVVIGLLVNLGLRALGLTSFVLGLVVLVGTVLVIVLGGWAIRPG